MKKAMKIVLAMAMVLLMSGGAMAQDFNAQGSAIIPHIESKQSPGITNYTNVYVSNITNGAVKCKITIYDQNGNDVSGLCSVYVVAADNTTYQVLSSGGSFFDLLAHSTVLCTFNSGVPQTIVGYGSVKWSSTDSHKQKALVGVVNTSYSVSSQTHAHAGTVALNNGQPF